MALGRNEVADLKLAVTEACSNAMRHGYAGSTGGEIELELVVAHDRLEVVVEDHGAGIALPVPEGPSELGGMGLEGAVRLGYRKELEAIDDPARRDEVFQEMVDRMYEHGKAVSVATHFEIDDVIDPADTRRWITTLLDAAPETHWNAPGALATSRRPNIDTW